MIQPPTINEDDTLRIIEPDGTKTSWLVTKVEPGRDGSVSVRGKRLEDKPKTIVEEILEEIDSNSASSMTFLEERQRLRSALAEAVEYMWGRAIYKQKGAEFDGLTSILAMLKGEKIRDLPKP